MSLSYEPLWRMLEELNISKMEFANRINVSNATLAKFGKNEPVTLTIIDKICDVFNCDVNNIVTHTPSPNVEPLSIDRLIPGTIVKSPCYPLKTSVRTKNTNFPPNNCDCLILKSPLKPSNETNKNFLIAPLLYRTEPETILDIPFNDARINNIKSLNGYIQIGKMGSAFSSSFESIIGKIPIYYIELIDKFLKDIKPLLISYNLGTDALLDRFIQ